MTGNLISQLITRARAGDGDAFRQIVEPHRRELHVHCYRILGSVQDAEDALQDTLLAAWQGLSGFEQRASVRTWLYRIATSRCLNALRSRRRRPQAASSAPPGLNLPEPTRLGEVSWLEPYPDLLLDGLPDSTPGPEAQYESAETISLAFITALQLLAPRQRAVLVLRDVLGFRAREAADILETTEESVTSALKRARAALQHQLPSPSQADSPAAGSPAERHLVARLTDAYQAGNVTGLIALLTDDVWLTMPPMPLEYQGVELVGRFMTAITFREERQHRLIATRANAQLAFGVYIRDPQVRMARANGLMVLTLAGSKVCAMTRFDNSVLPWFGLPRCLPD